MANLNQGDIAQQQLQAQALKQLQDAGYYPGYSNSLGADADSNSAIKAIMNQYQIDQQSLGQEIQSGTSNPHSSYYGSTYTPGNASYNLPGRETNHSHGLSGVIKTNLSNPIFQAAMAAITLGQSGLLSGLSSAVGGTAAAGASSFPSVLGSVGSSLGIPGLGDSAGGITGLSSGEAAATGIGDETLSGIESYLNNPYTLPAASGLASGGYNYSQNHDIGSALKTGAAAGAGSYIGGNIGGAIAGSSGSTISSGLNTALGPDIGSFIGGGLGSLGGTSLGSLAGGAIGSNLATSLIPQTSKNVNVGGGSSSPAAFNASRAPAQDIPLSLKGTYGSLTDLQQGTNLATQGVYGGGNGPQESDYFTNIINRRLVDDTGKVDSDLNDIQPIESSYLSQLGLGGYSNAQSLLEMLSKRKPATL